MTLAADFYVEARIALRAARAMRTQLQRTAERARARGAELPDDDAFEAIVLEQICGVLVEADRWRETARIARRLDAGAAS
jgi:hypothetical protein